MKYIQIPNSKLNASKISLGCMRSSAMSDKEISTLIHTAWTRDQLFRHADIYGGGKSEARFAEALGMNASLREKMILQSKCGMSQGSFDFSKDHILEAVDGSCSGCGPITWTSTSYPPDALVEPKKEPRPSPSCEQRQR